jgi:hypothetical protein
VSSGRCLSRKPQDGLRTTAVVAGILYDHFSAKVETVDNRERRSYGRKMLKTLAIRVPAFSKPEFRPLTKPVGSPRNGTGPVTPLLKKPEVKPSKFWPSVAVLKKPEPKPLAKDPPVNELE